jgi:hypothetical protein
MSIDRSKLTPAQQAQIRDHGYVISDAPDNSVPPGMVRLNVLEQISKNPARAAEFEAWKAAHPHGIDWTAPDLQGLPPKLLSQWAARNPALALNMPQVK